MENELHSQLSEIIQRLDPPVRDTAEADRLRLLRAGIISFPQLFDIVKSPTADEELRIIGIWFLDKLPSGESTITAMSSMLYEASPALRRAVIESAGKLGNKELVPLLIEHLQDDPANEVRSMAAYSLGLIGDPRALEPLCTIVANAQAPERLRGMAAEALGNLGDVGATTTLFKALLDPSLEIQYWAAYALGELPVSGPDLTEVRTKLKKLATSAVGRLRDQAIESLSRLIER